MIIKRLIRIFYQNINFLPKYSNLVPDESFEVARFTTSLHGNPMLLDSEGNTYRKNNSTNERIHWRCSKYKSLKCPVRATTEGNFVVKWVGDHNH